MSFHHRAVLIRGGKKLQAFAALGEPSPAGTEASCGGGAEFFLESIEAAKGSVNGLRDVAGGTSAGAGRQDLPKHGVVDVAAAIIANGGTDVLGHDRAIVGEELLDGFVLQVGR